MHIPLFISKQGLHASLSLTQPPYGYSFALSLLFFLFVLLLFFCLIFSFLAFSALVPFCVLFQPLTPLTAGYRSNLDYLKPKKELGGESFERCRDRLGSAWLDPLELSGFLLLSIFHLCLVGLSLHVSFIFSFFLCAARKDAHKQLHGLPSSGVEKKETLCLQHP